MGISDALFLSVLQRVVDRARQDLFPVRRSLLYGGARAIAANRNARHIDDALACEVARVLHRSEMREKLQSEGRILLIDHADGRFRGLSVPAGTPVPARSVAVSKRPPPGAKIPHVARFKFPPRRGEFPALKWREEWEFDVFISYRIRKHLAAARQLRNELTRLHYKVWLDEDQIGAADDPRHMKVERAADRSPGTWSRWQPMHGRLRGTARSRGVAAGLVERRRGQGERHALRGRRADSVELAEARDRLFLAHHRCPRESPACLGYRWSPRHHEAIVRG